MNSTETATATSPRFYQQVFRSVFPYPLKPRDERDRRQFLRRNLILHFRPATLDERTLRFTHTWGLGGIAATLILCQLSTGILLKFAYEPTPLGAYASVQALMDEVSFGRWIRNIHFWCANLLVAAAFLHMLRVFFTGAIRPPRQFNWVVGWAMFGFLLAANFTGYLLPWDQLAFWAVTVSTGMLEYIPFIGLELQRFVHGGDEIGPATLKLFFAFHTTVLPVVLIGLMAFHFWRVRKSGGVVIPKSPSDSDQDSPLRVPVFPDLYLREGAVALAVIAFVALLSALVDAPLEDPANPGLSPNPTKAPWYFAGFQELLLHLHPVVAVCVIPLTAIAALAILPYLSHDPTGDGSWFLSPRGKKMATLSAVAAAIAVCLAVAFDEYVLGPGRWFAGLPLFIRNGLFPAAFIAAALFSFCRLMQRRFQPSRKEAIQALVVLIFTAFVVFTVIGSLFRGASMKLSWPW